MEIGKIARDAVCVPPQTTVMEAIEIMEENEVSMVIVAEGDRPSGLFTLRDVARKVVRDEMDPRRTQLGDVMTAPIRWASRGTKVRDAIETMLEHHIHHLPIVNRTGEIEGFVSFHYLLRDLWSEAEGDLITLQSYLNADGGGG